MFKTMNCLTVIKHFCRHAAPLNLSLIRFTHTELKRELALKIPAERSRITEIRRRQAKEKFEDPKQGMLGLDNLIWETSEQNDEHELVFRGYSIPKILNELPKLPGSNIPPAEGHFWLLLTGKIPSMEQLKSLMQDWDKRAIVPFYVEKLIREMPATTPPVDQLSAALNILQSKFVESYTNSGVFKEKYWEMVLEDCMDLIAKVPTIAALIYNKLYRHKMFLPMRKPNADWASNFATQLGVNNKNFTDLMRLFMIVYSDLHGRQFSESASLGGSALSDPYKSYANGLKQLASNESGFYAHDHVEFLKKVSEEVGRNPTKALITEYLQCREYQGKDIPGYAKLNFKETDPRYISMLNFAKEHFKDDPLIQLTELVSDSICEMNNTVANVDAISGLLFYLFGIRDESFYPVMFGISRSLGLLSSYVWDRALGVPIDKKSSQSVDATSIPLTKMPSKGTCADFIKSHGTTNKLAMGIEIPAASNSVTSLDVLHRKPSQQQSTMDLSTTLPSHHSSSSSMSPPQISSTGPQVQSYSSIPPMSQSSMPNLQASSNPQLQSSMSPLSQSSMTTSQPSSSPQIQPPMSPLTQGSMVTSQEPSNPQFQSSPMPPSVQPSMTTSQGTLNPQLSSSQIPPLVPSTTTTPQTSSNPHLEPSSTPPLTKPAISSQSPSTSQFQSSTSISPQPSQSPMSTFQTLSNSPDSSVNETNGIKPKDEVPIENKKSRHIMLNKPVPVNTTGSYSNRNWGTNFGLKAATKPNPTTADNKASFQNSQMFHKRVGIERPNVNKTNSISGNEQKSIKSKYFAKEKPPLTNSPNNKNLCRTKKSSSIDIWKINSY